MALDPLASPFDTQEEDIFTLEQPRVSSPVAPYQGVTRQDYGVGEQYETTEEAFSQLPSYLSGLEEKRATTDKKYNRLNYDPSEFVRAGFTSCGLSYNRNESSSGGKANANGNNKRRHGWS